MKPSRALLPFAVIGLALAIVVALVLAVVGLAWFVAAPVGVAVAAALGFWWWRGTADRVLASIGATALVPGAESRLENMIDGLCVSHGFPRPRLFVVPDPSLNAAVVSSSHDHPALVFTRGLLDASSPVQLEAVLAHLLVIARDEDASAATHLVPLLGSALTRPLAGPAVEASIDGQRVIVADLAGVALTRYPPGLISALEAIRDGGSAVAGAPAATAHLWLAPISAAPGVTGGAEPQSIHPPLELRIATLREL